MRSSASVCLLLILLLSVPGLSQTPTTTPPAQPPPPPAPVIQATVNGSPISDAHVDRAINDRWAVPIMRQIIEDRLVRQEARGQGIKVAPEAVAALFKAERDRFASEEAFQRHLHEQGYTSESYAQKLTTDALLGQLLDAFTAVTEAQVKQYYDGHKTDFTSPAEAHLFLIMTDSIEGAYLVRERLASGDKFSAVARELSKHPSANKGGDLGWVRAADLPDRTIAEAILAMEPGEVSNPLRADEKYYIALVSELKPQQTVPLEEARPAIAARLKGSRAVSREDYINYLARHGDIAVTWAPARHLADEYLRLRVIGIVVNDKPLELAEPPVLLPSGILIVPAKPVLQAIGAAMSWKAAESSLTAGSPAGRVKLTVGSSKAIIGTDKLQARDMKQPPTIRAGALFIAPRVALEALGATVEWDGIRNRLVVTTLASAMPSPTVPPTPGGLERQ